MRGEPKDRKRMFRVISTKDGHLWVRTDELRRLGQLSRTLAQRAREVMMLGDSLAANFIAVAEAAETAKMPRKGDRP